MTEEKDEKVQIFGVIRKILTYMQQKNTFSCHNSLNGYGK